MPPMYLYMNFATKITVIFAIAILFVSCTTEKKASNFYDKHKDKLAEKCATNFPVHDSTFVKDSVRFDTIFLEGEPVVLKDSFYIKGDTIVKQITKECPKVQTIIKTVTHDSIIIRRDVANEVVLQNVIKRQNDTISRQKLLIEQKDAKVKTKNKFIWWLLIVVIIESIWIFRVPIMKLINPIKSIPL